MTLSYNSVKTPKFHILPISIEDDAVRADMSRGFYFEHKTSILYMNQMVSFRKES